MVTLREARLRRLLSQRDLAEQAGVALKTVVDVEHGRIEPRLSTMRRLCEALDVEPSEITEFQRALDSKVAA